MKVEIKHRYTESVLWSGAVKVETGKSAIGARTVGKSARAESISF